MDLRVLKQRIYNEAKIPTLLAALDCDHIHEEQGGELIVCQLPSKFHSDNRRSVQIKNTESMWGCIRSRGITGDIYTIIGYILYDITDFEDVKSKIHDIKHWICTTLSYVDEDEVWNGEITKDWNSWLRPIQKSRPKDVYELENEELDESTLGQYIPLGHMAWIKEGINIQTQQAFGVAYDMDTDRIVYPVYARTARLIGVKGRYVGDDPEILDRCKYLALHPWQKSIELYNLHRALPHIQEKQEVIVVESAKACMLLTQWGWGNCVSIEGFPISDTQIRLLKELRVPIVFAFDKDVDMVQIEKCSKNIKSRLVYCVYDTEGLLSAKDSPTDKGIQVWEKLFLNKQKKH